MKAKLDSNPEMLSITEDHQILHFRSKADCATVLKGSLWFLAE